MEPHVASVIEKLSFKLYFTYINLNVNSHMWLVVTVVYSTDVAHVCLHRRFYWTALLGPDLWLCSPGFLGFGVTG